MLRSQTVRQSVCSLLLALYLTAPAWADPLVKSKTSIQAEYLRYNLENARSLKCTFSTGMRADWEGGKLTTSGENEEFILHFDNIAPKEKRARLIGNQGAADIAVMLTPSGLTFVEVTPSGNLNFTTVFPAYKKETQEFIAVTSRHILLMDPFPSQLHGSCERWD